MQLILARHGEPVAATAEPGSAGADPELSARGRTQASALGWWAANATPRDTVTEIVTSPMRRARETAAPAADALELVPVVDADLAEFDLGRADYRPERERAASGDPDWQRLVDGHLPAWVDAAAFTARVRAALDRIVARHSGRDSVLVVCHAGVINTMLGAELGTARALPFPLEHAGLSRILVSRDGGRRVRSVNETGHVADLL